MPNKPDLSILILTHDNAALLEKCIRSIYDHTRCLTLEIIVIANQCQDNTTAMLKNKFPAVIILETETNEGFCQANNRGLKIAKGGYLLLQNDDTELKNNAFEILVNFLAANPKAGICGPLLLNPDLTPQRQGGIFGKKFWKAQKPCRTDFVAGAALLIKRETFNQIGLLDENLYFYNDDLDWCHSARKAGWQVYIVPEAQVMHYGGYSTKKAFSRRHFVAGFTGGLYLCKKHYGTTAYWIYKILLLLLLPLAMLFSLLGWLTFREEFKDKFLAYCDVFFYALGH